ncbi:alpha/beta hydrolase [Leifsonia sp. LS1]|uniref:alpha/beta fold hydrolase n=1 Tax=Leifsonia sp. LS1 TaxID=2828483 RepID=UPI001CFD02E7|nr:alpha/beta fold hydrolase [Leifsonia sp. LS1]GIT81594.1 alpha/beta hydrolase [Leifsonia sp. LS1]
MTDAARTRFDAIAPFGALPVPPGVDIVGLPARVGTLTAFHAAPSGAPRGTVLVVPGFTGSKEDFRDFLPLLAARGWDAWSYSQRGQGDSAAPAGVGAYRLEDFAADAVESAALAGDGQPVHLVGHSFGGVVAQAAVLASPASFASVTLLCSGPHGWPGRHQETTDIVARDGSMGLWYRDNPDTRGLPDAALPIELAFLRLRAERTSRDNLLAGAEILRTQTDVTDELHATSVRALVAHGEHDDKWPIPDQRDMAERLGAAYAVIPGGGHLPQVEAPQATLAVLDAFFGAPPGPASG